eukprot:5171014-Pyramimonas_sp.AAC.1
MDAAEANPDDEHLRAVVITAHSRWRYRRSLAQGAAATYAATADPRLSLDSESGAFPGLATPLAAATSGGSSAGEA